MSYWVEISKNNKSFNGGLGDGKGEEINTVIYLKSEKSFFCFWELSLFWNGFHEYP